MHVTVLKDGKGDHDIWTTPQGKRIVVRSRSNPDAPANGILKEANLPKAF